MFVQKTVFSFIFCAILFLQSSIYAEIEEVTITWRAASCDAGCGVLLNKEFRKIYGVADVQISVPEGQATLKWKPNAPITFQSLDTAMHMVGPGMQNLRMKIKGHIQSTTSGISLVSDGDGTLFPLISTIHPQVNQYTETESIYNRKLSPDIQKQLLEIQKSGQSVTIDGPVFEFWNAPPLILVVEHIKAHEVSVK